MATVPAIAYLDGIRLRRGLRAGIERLITDCELLNKINVFPVADGDTGTNLVMTMDAVLASLAADGQRHAGRTLTMVADAALDGAHGNSGVILAQFFQGICDTVGESARLYPHQFVGAVQTGARYAREALSDPVEGTILTVMNDFADALSGYSDSPDFVPLLVYGLDRAETSLSHTREQLAALQKAGVVDAGAKGFVDLLEGMVELMSTGFVRDRPPAREPAITESIDNTTAQQNESQHRFCTECMISGETIDRRKLRESLAGLGASLVVAGTRCKVRIHIHADDPGAVFDLAAQHGAVSKQKADDMHRQQYRPRSRVAIVTDSACDLPDAEFERLDIHMVPARVHFGERSYLDKVSLSADMFYEELLRNPQHPTTSQPPPGDFRRQFELLASHHEAVLSINLTAKLSGTWQAAVSAAGRVRSGRLEVVDCRNASLGEGLIVMHAAECAHAGLSVEEIIASVERAIPKTRTYALLGDLNFGVRGGRIPRSLKILADWLRLTPVVCNTIDGRIGNDGVLFGKRDRVDKFATHVLKRLHQERTYRVGVGHARSEDRARHLMDRFTEYLPNIEVMFCTEIGTALGAHGGPGTLVVAVQESMGGNPGAKPGSLHRVDKAI